MNSICIRKKKLLRLQWSPHYWRLTVRRLQGHQNKLYTDSLNSEATSKLNRAWATSPASSVLNMFGCLCASSLNLWTLENTPWIQQVLIPAQQQSWHWGMSAPSWTMLLILCELFSGVQCYAMSSISKDTFLVLWTPRERFPTNSVKKFHH